MQNLLRPLFAIMLAWAVLSAGQAHATLIQAGWFFDEAAGLGPDTSVASLSQTVTAANGAITALSRSLAREFGPDGIRVNALAPGWVLTEKQLEKWATPEGLAAHLDRQCLKTHLVPQDITDAVLFLASDASRMMTGQCMVVDGGVVTTG